VRSPLVRRVSSRETQLATDNKPSLSTAEYERMAAELDAMAESIRARPEINHHFAERLTLLAKQMREDSIRAHPLQKS
jgi:hypothetical protein